MKDDIHPNNFRQVIFQDTTSGEEFLFASTVETDETGTWEDGEEYPLARVEMSSASHPFYTGVETVVDTAGRVEKFKARFDKAEEKREQQRKRAESKSAKQKEAESSSDDETSTESEEETKTENSEEDQES